MSATPLHDPHLRLECLKLATRAGRDPEANIAEARRYLDFVAGSAPLPADKPPKDPQDAAPGTPDKPTKQSAPRGARS